MLFFFSFTSIAFSFTLEFAKLVTFKMLNAFFPSVQVFLIIEKTSFFYPCGLFKDSIHAGFSIYSSCP